LRIVCHRIPPSRSEIRSKLLFGTSTTTDEDGDTGVHGTGSKEAHGMQNDGVGIGDIVDVQGVAGGAGVEAGSTGGGDSRSALWERDTDVISTVLFCPVMLTLNC